MVEADKKRVGAFLGKSVFSHRFSCISCPNYLEIRLEPQTSSFIIVKGGARKRKSTGGGKELNCEEDIETVLDPFEALDTTKYDLKREKEIQEIETIQRRAERRHADSVAANRLLRSLHRPKRQKDEASTSLSIPLLQYSAEDEKEAQSTMRSARSSTTSKSGHKLAKTIQQIQKDRQSASIFVSKPQIDSNKERLLSRLDARQKPTGSPHR